MDQSGTVEEPAIHEVTISAVISKYDLTAAVNM